MQATFTPHPLLRVLRVDASARAEGSITRQLADQMIEGLKERISDVSVIHRDVAQGLPFVDEAWVNATSPTRTCAARRIAKHWQAPMRW